MASRAASAIISEYLETYPGKYVVSYDLLPTGLESGYRETLQDTENASMCEVSADRKLVVLIMEQINMFIVDCIEFEYGVDMKTKFVHSRFLA